MTVIKKGLECWAGDCGLTSVVNGEPWEPLEQGEGHEQVLSAVENGVIVGDRAEIAGPVRRVAGESGWEIVGKRSRERVREGSRKNRQALVCLRVKVMKGDLESGSFLILSGAGRHGRLLAFPVGCGGSCRQDVMLAKNAFMNGVGGC